MTKILASYGISWNLQNEVQEPKIDSFIKDVLTIKGCDGWWQYDDSRSQELLERKIKNAPKGRGSVKMSHERSGRSIEKSGPGLRLSPRLPTLIPK
ncbi:hypothetical protein D0Y65_052884 [Glycine soja]|uniref:Uncharacterized protein n=1 Tax=Glycine soja TaxID=3848 RepID=A0A445EZT3_GLYSO|nr:hypothetical protein D0Y65_052884 [Glycine soja]